MDIVKNNPGIHVKKLTKHFEFSRYAVMKHLKILENADLIVPQKVGKNKNLYLNAISIQTIYDRWISGFSALWAEKITTLKYQLEEGDKIMTQEDLKYVFVTYIKTTKEKLWDALTNPKITKQYFFGSPIRSDFKKGSPIEFIIKDEKGHDKIGISGVIKELIPYKRIVHTFKFHDKDDLPSRVTYEIEETDKGLKLTVIHDQFEGKTATYNDVIEGWPYILSGLKTVLETGKPL